MIKVGDKVVCIRTNSPDGELVPENYMGGHCLVDRNFIIPYFKWREQQMDSILN